MGKSSSSSKKLKRSKEDPSKLRSVKKKKKTKRSKSKKIRRIKDSSDEESESDSSLYSSSSSEDEYRREKRRSKLSKKKKKRKKRSRKRYSSSSESDDDYDDDDDDDDDISLLKKKKRSKRKDQHEHVGTKKKKNKRIVSRKRLKRESTSSSTSSDEGSESDGNRMTREQESEEDDESWRVEDEAVTEKNNSRRLKSIVVVTYNYDDGERKEGMVDDKSDENMIVDDHRDGEAITRAHDNRRIGYDEFEEHHSSETSKASHSDNSLNGDDLEAILKKRALENLKRFRGETQKNETVRKVVPSVSGGETLQPESEKFEESQDRPLMEENLCVSAGDKDLETSQRMLQVVDVNESGTGLADSASQQDQQSGDAARVKAGAGISSCTTKRRLIRPVLGKESLNLADGKEAAGCQDAEAEGINGKSCPEDSLALATKNGGENVEPTNVTSTSASHDETELLDENKGESQSEQKTNDETKDESQYEQKTMTVMRGGELVQVSYKVYIPKKTSLGRRKLRR